MYADVTLYGVELPPIPSQTVEQTIVGLSAIGVGEDGATTYAQEYLISRIINSGQLINPTPFTLHRTCDAL